MEAPELYVPARERIRRTAGLGFARLWFVLAALFVAYFGWMWLSHLGERVAREYFDVALFGAFVWWGAYRVLAWVARGFGR